MPPHFSHHFPGATSFVNQVSRSIQMEWKKLKDNLPDGVHVVTYENHIDLIKVRNRTLTLTGPLALTLPITRTLTLTSTLTLTLTLTLTRSPRTRILP